ncbi:hypothetical protein B5C26_00805 [Photorhabdus luminescens]|uniref:hypothetical protein n=1 Tax=Photorhabdus luminescens TaxID=29488 RepID=UPI000B4C4C86|nr:hypothetical protein [Photorhabdus luminescens]OWO86990.1 hypothetical protein B5C26_00805 [Photorhabdus luminescens]
MSENKKHVHAELMLQYAQDAFKTDEPWLMWEFFCRGSGVEWIDLFCHPLWNKDCDYRRKPEMITIGKVSFPKPVDYELNNGDKYYSIIDSMLYDECGPLIWFGDNIDVLHLNNRCIHLTKEAARQHAEALIKISRGEF